jgi:hypothetical protein
VREHKTKINIALKGSHPLLPPSSALFAAVFVIKTLKLILIELALSQLSKKNALKIHKRRNQNQNV